ncbi:hypothetical protein AB0I53_08930 [Saccharopolyspora sp. NPDC050389]|uniref:hypothetical protein n=1 Tax=Saccharopolyspora sp. NPDC050389 TaxID=3155516 RepID=UPI0033DBE65B
MNQFWVDPENLSKSGQGYGEVQARLLALRQRAAQLGARYQASFGDDDEGREFFQNFKDGQEKFLNGVGHQAKSLGYISDGLYENGKMYGGSRDEADQLSHKFKTAGENGSGDSQKPTGHNVPAQKDVPLKGSTVNVPVKSTGHNVPAQKEIPLKGSTLNVPVKSTGHNVPAQKDVPLKGSTAHVAAKASKALAPNRGVEPNKPSEKRTFVKSQRAVPAGGRANEGLKPQLPVSDRGYPLNGLKPEDVEVRKPGMTSAMRLRALRENEQPMVYGHPLGEGQHIVSATELSNGAVRIGVDGYSDITPLNGRDLTLDDPNNPSGSKPYPTEDGERHFLVTEKSGSQQPGKSFDEQVYMEFPRDGEPSFFRFRK